MDGILGIKAVWKNGSDKEEKRVYAEYIKGLFEKISDEDTVMLGFSTAWCRPEWLICSVLLVPPPSVRPSVNQGDSQRMDDDLTHKMADIIKFNNGLQKKMENNNKQEIENTKFILYNEKVDLFYNMFNIHRLVHFRSYGIHNKHVLFFSDILFLQRERFVPFN